MIRRFVGFVFVLVGCLALLVGGAAYFWSEPLQSLYVTTLPPIETTGDGVPREAPAGPKAGHPIGRLEIPRLGLQSLVVEGDDPAALLIGVGHLSDTPLPWHEGNSVLAAHRDTFFRPLGGIQENDVIRFVTADSEIEYIVRETMVVGPTAVEVLAPTAGPTLTLITCHPFNYIGPAPNRFIVRAERVSSSAQSLTRRPASEFQPDADLAQQP